MLGAVLDREVVRGARHGGLAVDDAAEVRIAGDLDLQAASRVEALDRVHSVIAARAGLAGRDALRERAPRASGRRLGGRGGAVARAGTAGRRPRRRPRRGTCGGQGSQDMPDARFGPQFVSVRPRHRSAARVQRPRHALCRTSCAPCSAGPRWRPAPRSPAPPRSRGPVDARRLRRAAGRRPARRLGRPLGQRTAAGPAGRGSAWRARARRVTVDVFQRSAGRRVLGERRVAHFARAPARRALARARGRDGLLSARFIMRRAGAGATCAG